MQELIEAKFSIGDVVKHKFLNFRGVIFDLDPTFNNTEDWYNAIPEDFRPKKDQPFYHLFAENEEIFYIAYVSEQNLNIDNSGITANHPDIMKVFSHFNGLSYVSYEKTKN
jgi:heat shock protein HspQ